MNFLLKFKNLSLKLLILRIVLMSLNSIWERYVLNLGILENVNENIDDFVINIINLFVLLFDVRKLDKYVISIFYRFGFLNKEKLCDIIVCFVRYWDKVVVYVNKINFKGFNINFNNSYRIFINEVFMKKWFIIYVSVR